MFVRIISAGNTLAMKTSTDWQRLLRSIDTSFSLPLKTTSSNIEERCTRITNRYYISNACSGKNSFGPNKRQQNTAWGLDSVWHISWPSAAGPRFITSLRKHVGGNHSSVRLNSVLPEFSSKLPARCYMLQTALNTNWSVTVIYFYLF